DRGDEPGEARGPEALEILGGPGTALEQPGETAGADEELARERDRVGARDPGPEHDGEELGVRQGLRARLQQLLARSLARRPEAERQAPAVVARRLHLETASCLEDRPSTADECRRGLEKRTERDGARPLDACGGKPRGSGGKLAGGRA